MTDAPGRTDALEDSALRERLDPTNMLDRIASLPGQCMTSWSRARSFDWPDCSRSSAVVFLGMGGSAIAGDILRTMAAATSRKPVVVSRGYDPPEFVGGSTLVIACSHSGNTEETLGAFERSLAMGARPVVISRGGELTRMARERNLPCYSYDFAGEPRSALGCQLMALTALGERAGLLPDQDEAVGEAVAIMRTQLGTIGAGSPFEANAAKQLASRLHGTLPAIFGAGLLSEAAHRWKTQLNENSNTWALWDELPELDHNAVVGFGLPAVIASNIRVVLLSNERLHPRVRRRYGPTEEELAGAGVAFERVVTPGESPLAQVLAAVYLGDFVSYYLALLNGVNPAAMDPITRIRERMARDREV
jgi:glucose/mannose-6-phosphate isomerase